LVRKRKEGGLAPFLLIISQGRGSVWGSYCGASLGVLSTHWGFYLKKKVNGGDYFEVRAEQTTSPATKTEK